MRHLLFVPLLFALTATASAQHCPPIRQSFLSEMSMKWVGDTLDLRAEYTKGGVPKAAYQAYVVAYLEKDRKLVPGAKGKDILNPKMALVLNTTLIKRNKHGTYDLHYSISDKELIKRVIEHRKLGAAHRTKSTNWYVYKDRIRIAVFIPFLEDKKYATIEGLPEDRHECNYAGERALLFQTLPNCLSFMTARAKDLKRKVWVRINGDKPEIE